MVQRAMAGAEAGRPQDRLMHIVPSTRDGRGQRQALGQARRAGRGQGAARAVGVAGHDPLAFEGSLAICPARASSTC